MSGTRALREIAAPAAWQRIDFISDLHLSAETPRTFDAWEAYLLGTRADAVFILGDLFEAWIGDDSRHDGFEARGAAVLAAAAARRPVYFMVGNRDFLVGDDMLTACGVQALEDPTLLRAFGARTLLTHGDAWCLGDLEYQQFRRQVRDPAWQAQVLKRPLAERRLMARGLRSES
ncbi:MAG TPA: UDP-2,3-diacylglucosamine diphosphatase, partial [Burkholderiaceae bacterium]